MTRVNVKAILDYLLARAINLDQARQQLAALGAAPGHLPERFLSGELSYDDVFAALGV